MSHSYLATLTKLLSINFRVFSHLRCIGNFDNCKFVVVNLEDVISDCDCFEFASKAPQPRVTNSLSLVECAARFNTVHESIAYGETMNTIKVL